MITTRIGSEGVVCYVNNNSFIQDLSFDGMRKHLARDFDLIWVLDLGGDMRDKASGSNNVFGITVGVSINVFVRLPQAKPATRKAIINYAALPEELSREAKLDFLSANPSVENIAWRKLRPDKDFDWFPSSTQAEFRKHIPIGSKAARAQGGTGIPVLFRTYSPGVNTARDKTAYDFDKDGLASKVEVFCENFNSEIARWIRRKCPADIDRFVDYGKLKWSENLKRLLKQKSELEADQKLIRRVLYRPFTKRFGYLGKGVVDRIGSALENFPSPKAERENRVIAICDIGNRATYTTIAASAPVDLHVGATTDLFQVFPLYTYNEDGKERRDNIPLSTLNRFSIGLNDDNITREHIFYYVYAVLHHPEYRTRYAENLKRELPRIPMPGTAADFHAFADAGRKLADLHVGYESVKPFPLQRTENPDVPVNWRVEAMKLGKDERHVVYNDWLTLGGIPPEALAYRLGNRSALGWVIDQYRVERDADGELVSDPNVPDDEEAIVRLVGQVVAVSVETMRLIRELPGLNLP